MLRLVNDKKENGKAIYRRVGGKKPPVSKEG